MTPGLLRADEPVRFTHSRAAMLAACLGLTALMLWIANGAGVRGAVAVGGLLMLIPGYRAAVYAWRHESWLLFGATLLALLISATFLANETLRAIIHYSLVMLICLPCVPRAWRSGLLGQGGFRLYMIYFCWSLVTVSYSLAPLYSVLRLTDAILMFLTTTCCVSNIRSPDDAMRLLARVLMAASMVTAVVVLAALLAPHAVTWQSPQESIEPAVLQQMRALGISVDGIERFRGIFGGPNDVGLLTLVTVGPALVYWQVASRRIKWALAAVVTCAFSTCLLADSRSPMAALTVGIVLYCIWRYRIKGILAIAAAAVAGLVIAGLLGHDVSAYLNRGDVTTLTGRTDMWQFVIADILRRPLFGYGYAVSGAIFESRYFPLWWGPWDQGPHSSIHNGYLEHAVGVGIPATMFWLAIMLYPWITVFRSQGDPWHLKSIALLIVIPLLVYNLTEAALGDCIQASGLLFGLAWAIGERYRMLLAREREQVRREALAQMPHGVAALVG